MSKRLEQHPKLVIFDLDGTLIDFHHDYLYTETVRIISELDHPPVSREELAHHFSLFDYFRFVLHDDRETFAVNFWEKFDFHNFPKPTPLPGAVEALKELSGSGVELAIVTARISAPEELRGQLADTGIVEHISHIITRPGKHIHWTDKTGTILEMCQKMTASPAETVMVGDVPTDVTSAAKVGVGTTVAVKSGGIKEEVLREAKPDFLLPDVTHLRKSVFRKD